jgi:hypothetical protein
MQGCSNTKSDVSDLRFTTGRLSKITTVFYDVILSNFVGSIHFAEEPSILIFRIEDDGNIDSRLHRHMTYLHIPEDNIINYTSDKNPSSRNKRVVLCCLGARVVVKALCYKLEGREFETR